MKFTNFYTLQYRLKKSYVIIKKVIHLGGNISEV